MQGGGFARPDPQTKREHKNKTKNGKKKLMKTVLRQTKTVEKELFPKYGREVDHQTP